MATKSFIKTIGEKGLLADYNTEGKKLQTELTAGDNITISADNVISADKQIFLATYGVTTYDEVRNAMLNGVDVFVKKDSSILHSMWLGIDIYFESVVANPTMIRQVILKSDNTWSTVETPIQSKLTFDSAPTAGSTNPVTSDGIKTELNAKQNSLTAGDNITIDGSTISSDQVFVAKYGTTTYKEIKAAYNAGKICTVFNDERYYYVTLIDSRHILFTSSNGKDALYEVSVGSGNTWSKYTRTLQSKLTFDSAPKAGSNNPVTSNGIKKVIDAVNADIVDLSQSVDDVKTGLNNLTDTAGSHATQIGQLQTDVESIESSLANKKDRQTELNFGGSATKTVKSITQDANGVIDVEYEDIDFVRGDSNVEIKSEDNSVNVVESTDSQTNTKTYDLSVADSVKSKIKDITISNDTLVIIGD